MLMELLIVYTCTKTHCQPVVDEYYKKNPTFHEQVKKVQKEIEKTPTITYAFTTADFFLNKRVSVKVSKDITFSIFYKDPLMISTQFSF